MKPSARLRANAELEHRKRRDRRIIESYRDDPVGFNEYILGRTLWAKQKDICRAVAAHDYTIVPAGRNVGKSFLLAGIVPWYVATRPNSLAITTGPDHRQVVTVLWKNMKRALRHNAAMCDKDPNHPRVRYDFISTGMGSPQRLEIIANSGWGAEGFACKSDEGLSGKHDVDLIMVVDEASGVEQHIIHTITGAGADKYLFVGNPIKYECEFRAMFDRATPFELASPGEQFVSVTISSLDHPDAQLEKSPIGAVSARWLRQLETIHGTAGQWWKSNILGQFPGQESVRFVPIEWINACDNEAILSDAEWIDRVPGRNRMSVDCGGGVGADPSVITIRNDKRLWEIFASKEYGVLSDARYRLESKVVEMARKWGVAGEDIIFDESGIGRAFGSYLANHGIHGAVGYFGGGSGGAKYKNRRTACAFAIKNRLDPNREGHVPFYTGGVPGWEMLRKELGMLMGAKMDVVEGRVKEEIESKESISSRLGHSSDYLDSALMSFNFS